MAPIPSGFETDRVFRLERRLEDGGLTWQLREHCLTEPFSKRYDNGDPEEWLASYDESVHRRDLRFVAAGRGRRADGLATWRDLDWNRSLWLIDIRVRESARRSGVGSALVDYVKGAAVTGRRRGISVETQLNNYPAVQFYRKHGFDVTGFNDHLYANDDLQRQDVALFLFWETNRH